MNIGRGLTREHLLSSCRSLSNICTKRHGILSTTSLPPFFFSLLFIVSSPPSHSSLYNHTLLFYIQQQYSRVNTYQCDRSDIPLRHSFLPSTNYQSIPIKSVHGDKQSIIDTPLQLPQHSAAIQLSPHSES